MPKPRKIISSSTIEDKQRKSLRANRSIGTSIEVIFGRLLYAAGVRYRKNDRKVCGSPDFTLPGLKIAVFCDGEFWHGRDWERRKADHKTNRSFWISKIEANMERDRQVNETLRQMGWKVFRFWETELRKTPDRCLNIILSQVNQMKNENISLSLAKQLSSGKINVRNFGPHALKSDGSVMSFAEQMAIVSHHLHNPSNKTLADRAQGLIADWTPSVAAEKKGRCAEEGAQYGLFRDFFEVPFPPPAQPRFTFYRPFLRASVVFAWPCNSWAVSVCSLRSGMRRRSALIC